MSGPWEDYAPAKPTAEDGPWNDYVGSALVPPPKSGLIRRGIGDTALSLGQGAVGAIKSITDVTGAGTKLSKTLGDIGQGMQNLLSPERQAEMSARQAKVDEADKSGSAIDQVTTRLGGFAEAPVQTLAQGIGSMVPTVAAAIATRGKSLVPQLALGTAMGVGGVKGQNYDAVLKEATDRGVPPDEAEALAQRAAEYSRKNATQQVLGGALGALDAGTGVERLVHGVVGKGEKLARRVAAGALEEGIPEGLQGGQGQYAQNVALNDAGFQTDNSTGVAGEALLQGAVGAVLGGAAGVPKRSAGHQATAPAAGQETPEAAAPVATAEAPAAPAAGDAIRAAAPPVSGPLTGGLAAMAESHAQRADAGMPPLPVGQAQELQGEEAARAQREADRPAAPTGAILPDDITKDGKPFTSMLSAQRALAKAGPGFELAPVAGGLVVRRVDGPATDFAKEHGAGADTLSQGELDPGFDVNELTLEQANALAGQPDDKKARRIPTGEATDLGPLETVEAAAPAEPQRAPRTPKAEPVKAMTDDDLVAEYVAQRRAEGTLAGRRFAGDFDAGRITPADVLALVKRKAEPTADERLAAAAAQATKGQDSGLIVPAGSSSKRKETERVEQPDVAAAAGRPAEPGAGRQPVPMGGQLVAGRVAADATGQQPRTAAATVAGSGEAGAAGHGGKPDGALTVLQLQRAWSEAVARGDSAEASRLNDLIVQAKKKAPAAPSPAEGSSAPTEKAPHAQQESQPVRNAQGRPEAVANPPAPAVQRGAKRTGKGTEQGAQQGPVDGAGNAGDAQGPRTLTTKTGTDVVPEGLHVEFGGKRYAVDSIEDAQRKWAKFRDSADNGGQAGYSQIGNGVPVYDGAGRQVARISYNGRAWSPSDELLAEAPAAASDQQVPAAPAPRTLKERREAAKRGGAHLESTPDTAPAPTEAAPPAAAKKTVKARREKAKPEGGAQLSTRTDETPATASAAAEQGGAQAAPGDQQQAETPAAAPAESAASPAQAAEATKPGEAAAQSAPGPAAAEAGKPAKIEDFGEKLEGARKDYAAQLREAQAVDVRKEPLSKSWPEPDYEKLLASGVDPWTVAFVRAAREAIPTKPQASWKLKTWAQNVETVRHVASQFLSGEWKRDAVEPFVKPGGTMNKLAGVIDLYMAVGHEKSLKGMSISVGSYSVYKGEHFNPAKVMWSVEQRAKSTAFGNWPTQIATGDTREQAIEAFKAKYADLKTGPAAAGKPQFDIYRKRGQEGAFIGKRIGREYVDLKKVDSVAEARKYLAGHADELDAALAKYKETPYERNTENAPRVGDDHRGGAPVTPEVFAETFGFRGVQFGNYVEQDRHQSDLNQAFDGLMDLAAVLGVPPRALSLNGKLGLAFGARGKGGKGAPAAHYEPGNVVINLTKGGGPGSLAHEWWHSLDNYFGKQGGDGGYVTSGTGQQAQLRAAMQSAFFAVRRASQVPTLMKRANELDKRKTKPYWATPHELAARAFESYVIAKLEDQGAANDYLANVVSKEAWDRQERLRGHDAESYPYPTADELPALRAAFDGFFQAVETRTDDAGNVAMFSRAPSVAERNALDALAENDDLFALPRSNGKTVGDIAADIDPGIKVSKEAAKPGTTETYKLTMPDGKVAWLYVREPNRFGPTVYAFDINDGEMTNVHDGRPGENPEDVPEDKQDVYIDVSKLERGSGGNEVYAIAGAFAHNTGRMFIGDPAGLSDEAMRRRAEAMLSLALRYGTTDFLAPHPRQVAGDKSIGVPALSWTYGDDLGNIRNLVDLNVKALENGFPAAKNLDFDVHTGSFLDATRRGPASVRAATDFGKRAAAIGASDQAVAGSRTVARNAVWRALLREEGGESAGGGRRDGLLAGLASLASNSPASLTGLFKRGAGGGVDLDSAKAMADTLAANGVLRLNVVRSVDDMPPMAKRWVTAKAPDGRVRGAYLRGTDQVWLFTDNIRGADEFVFVALHEAFHRGLANTIPDAKPLLREMARTNKALRDAAQAQVERHGIGMDEAIEEALADMAGDGRVRDLKGWDKLLAKVKAWLQKVADAVGVRMKWTDDMVADFVAGITREGLTSRVHVDANVDGAASLSPAQTNTLAFRRWFGDSKVVDADGKPLVVYHGTRADFSSFYVPHPEGKQRFYFAADPSVASEYTNDHTGRPGSGANMMPAFVALKNPAVVDGGGANFTGVDLSGVPDQLRASLPPEVVRRGYASLGSLASAAEAQGFDGVVARNVRDGAGPYGEQNPGDVYIAFKPEQIKSATGNSGAFDPTNPDITLSRAEPARDEAGRFSRVAPEAGPGRAQQRDIRREVRDRVGDLLGSAGAKVSVWDKTLATQYAKAEKFPGFKRVFHQVQQFLDDTSSMANEAADKAAKILPKLDTAADLRPNWMRKPEQRLMSDADGKALAAPIFTGTLTDKRTYSDDELRSRFKLTAPQIEQYRQFFAAVNTSLDQAVAADVVRLLGDKNPALRDMVIGAREELRAGVMAYLERQIEQGIDAEANQQLLADINDKYQRIDQLKAEGYAPLMRFGKYKLHVTGPQGQTLYFGLYESRADSNKAARELAADPEFQGATFDQGVLSQEQYKMFAAMPLDSMEMFAEAIGAERSEVFQQYIKLAKNNRSALKRLIERKGTAGFTQDVQRVLASFVTSNARMASGALNMPAAKDAALDIREGDIQDEAIKLIDTVQNPRDTAGAIRGLMFANFIGGSIASAVVNLTQPVTMTLPYLSQWGGPAVATARLLAASKIAATGKGSDSDLMEALKRAENGGIVSPQEIHHLTAQAMGTMGNHPLMQKAAFIWGAPFSLAEQFNRRVSFIAAYNTAKAQGIDDPYAFAEKAVIETQGLYNKANAPNWARNPIGATALTFKQFAIHYLEWMKRMWNAGEPGSAERRRGRMAVGVALALLMLAAGADGLPFAGDIDDLVDTLGQAMGLDVNSKRARREFIANTLGLGDEAGDVFARGLSAAPGIPLDVSLRMSMGDLIPATGLFLRSNTDASGSVLELAGPAGALAKQGMDVGKKALSGDFAGAMAAGAPGALQNVIKAIGMWTTGEARDSKDRKIMDVDEVDGLMKFLGFNPQSIARESEKMSTIRRSEQLAKNVEGEIVQKWARGVADKDMEAVAAARKMLAQWNEDNPEQPMRITPQQIRQRAQKMMQDRETRFLSSISRDRRAAAADALQ